MKLHVLVAMLLWPLPALAQLAVTVLPVKIEGNKALVPLAMKNNFTERVELARAVLFLMDDQGKVVGEASKWIIGGATNKPGLAAGATKTFYFVVQGPKPFTTTNLTERVRFSRLTLEGGKILDPNRDVVISK